MYEIVTRYFKLDDMEGLSDGLRKIEGMAGFKDGSVLLNLDGTIEAQFYKVVV